VSIYGLENVRPSGAFRLSTLVIAPLRQISILSLVVRRDLIDRCTSLPQGWSDKNAQKGMIRCNYCAKVSRALRGTVRTVEPYPSFRGTNLENKNSPIGMRHSCTSTLFVGDSFKMIRADVTPSDPRSPGLILKRRANTSPIMSRAIGLGGNSAAEVAIGAQKIHQFHGCLDGNQTAGLWTASNHVQDCPFSTLEDYTLHRTIELALRGTASHKYSFLFIHHDNYAVTLV
jgi:hypothetical protein